MLKLVVVRLERALIILMLVAMNPTPVKARVTNAASIQKAFIPDPRKVEPGASAIAPSSAGAVNQATAPITPAMINPSMSTCHPR